MIRSAFSASASIGLTVDPEAAGPCAACSAVGHRRPPAAGVPQRSERGKETERDDAAADCFERGGILIHTSLETG
jgi:hypothetical protein